MDEHTIHRLNEINREFYRVTATEFDATRGQAWHGWEQLLPHLPPSLRVLDVGCGNGRFGAFLAENLSGMVDYHGLDNAQALLQAARESLASLPNLSATLEQRDIVHNPPAAGSYDLVTLFGVIHHIPGYENRRQFMRLLAQCVAPSGWLVFASWRFYDSERLRARIVPWDGDLTDKVERHDYLLDWRRGERALRYCHYVDDDEQQALIDATQLNHVASYFADGYNGRLNRYSILQAAPAKTPQSAD